MPFEKETLPPIRFLAELREEVLKHSLKRMPKWKFRLASDLVLQLQPKPTVLLSEAATARGFKPKLQHFEGVAVMTEGVTGDVFKRLPYLSASPWCQIKFELYSRSRDEDWEFKRTGGCWQAGAERSETGTIVHRVTAAFRNGLFDGRAPAKMLSHNCVICGKGLTDPASIARWIGPECSGTSSLRVPFVIDASKSTKAEAA
jgi:Family of unknown function (DUF6011)